MVFVLVLFGSVIGVYLLLTVALLFVGLYGVFGAVIYGPLLLINYLQRVFAGETASGKSYDVHKVREVEAPGIMINSSTTSSSSIYPDMV